MKRHFTRDILITVIVMAGITSCSVTKQYTPQQTAVKGLYRDNDETDTTNMASLHWKEIFTDTLLQQLISTGINQNLNLQAAYSRIRQAAAAYEQSRLQFLPALSADPTAAFAGSSDPQSIGKAVTNSLYQTTLTASWEADIWGKLKSAKRASLANLLQAEANARAIQTSLVAGIASSYYTLLALDQQLAITQESVKNWQKTVDIMKELKTANTVTGAAIVQSEASKYAVSVTIPDLKRSIRETENQLNLLLGNVPGPVSRTTLDSQHPVTLLQTGVPAQLLANRPDVEAAEHNLRYYFELTNVARTYFYPSLTLSASAGYASMSSFWGVGSWLSNLTAGLSQPVFNQGVNKARLRAAREQQQQAALNFKNTVLTAGEDVSNAIYSYQMAGQKAADRNLQLENLRKSVEYTQELVRYGFANYTEVLTAQQNLLIAQLNKVSDREQQLLAIVSLYRALGGGWR
ncbi:efflux transporter outer membrane subunit [Chitinophaga filiformis]|uniref:Efflux transporter outer membrane subunit n=1 Tax=Chitinophaga filiformis TaxID=104663 RepID=A0ABY4I9W1_CHIFI|nr:efflux transporter outer membrane subunit [Chitinophaga filiformis]UPK72903.1 efflux transporter outer membrane subunit [Chitinophaga filiformis]